jgi:hypothetical protein
MKRSGRPNRQLVGFIVWCEEREACNCFNALGYAAIFLRACWLTRAIAVQLNHEINVYRAFTSLGLAPVQARQELC